MVIDQFLTRLTEERRVAIKGFGQDCSRQEMALNGNEVEINLR
jgi:hypothetical protein